MIKRLLLITICFVGMNTLSSCRDTTEKETVIREVDTDDEPDVDIEVEETDDSGLLERTGEKIDQEVNEEIDKKIDEIGDDN